MKKSFLTLFLMCSVAVSAQNPIVQTCYTSDPAPMVHGDKIYVYTGHDENNADFFWMYEWRLYSSTDMVNWTDHGVPLSLGTFKWADDRAWAAQCIERNGKFYWYICAHSKLTGGMAIGVAVANKPTGPFKDALGKPLFDNGKWDNIDPTVLIDDDGQAYVLWGNPNIYYAKLNPDMISLASEVKMVNQTVDGFGSPAMNKREKGVKYADCYTEGPWLNKRNGKYQLLYAAGGVPEHLAYSEATSIDGPWKYKGILMPEGNTKSFTNHCGVIDYKGHSYLFYHTGKLPGGGGFGRSTAVEEFTYNADGSLPLIQPTDKGVNPVGKLNPYQRVEGETMAFSKGITTEVNSKTGVYVADVHNGDWLKLQAVDFGNEGPKAFKMRAASALLGGTAELHIDSIGGTKIAQWEIPCTGGWETWKTFTTKVEKKVTGVHDLYFLFKGYKGRKLMNIDWWKAE